MMATASSAVAIAPQRGRDYDGQIWLALRRVLRQTCGCMEVRAEIPTRVGVPGWQPRRIDPALKIHEIPRIQSCVQRQGAAVGVLLRFFRLGILALEVDKPIRDSTLVLIVDCDPDHRHNNVLTT